MGDDNNSTSLRGELKASRTRCNLLRRRLEELAEFLEGLLSRVSEVVLSSAETPLRLGGLRTQLDNTHSLLADITLDLTMDGSLLITAVHFDNFFVQL